MSVPGGARCMALALSVLAAVLVLGVAGATAATITPNTTSDIIANDGQCSLREAITAAFTHLTSGPQPGECAAGTGEDLIHLEPGHYFLSIPGVRDDSNLSGDLDIRSNLTIQGAGAASTIIDAVGIDRVIEIMPNVAVRIEGVTITGGQPPAGGGGKEAKTGAPAIGEGGGEGEGGGGVLDLGTLTLADSIVSDNGTGAGGKGGDAHGSAGEAGIAGAGGPGGAGGGIEATGPLTIEHSTIVGNSTGAGGAGGSGFGGAGAPGIAGKSHGAGGAGGGGDGGEGGIGGGGAGVDAQAALSVLDSTISENPAGPGGAGGESVGGVGGNEAGAEDGGGGRGGSALGGRGGAGGFAAGLDSRDGAEILGSTFVQNTSGGGGAGNIGEAGHGGLGSPGGEGGRGQGGEGGEGGFAAGLRAAGLPGTVTVSDSTVTENEAGAGANAGGGIGGEGGGSVMFPGSPGSAEGGNGGIGGEAALATEGTGVPLTEDTVNANGTGPGGAGGSATGAGPKLPGGSEPAGSVAGVFVTLSATLSDSIVSSNSPANCGLAAGAALADGAHDISFDGGGCPGVDVDPELGPLQENGGPTPTEAIAQGSPAVDAVPATGAGCPAVDQRGVLRPAGAGCDIGAFEIATAGAVTGQVSGPSASSAILNGTARNPDLADATAFFQYGTTSSYGSQTAAQALGATTAAAPLSAGLTGLAPDTVYHFRLVVANAIGPVFGADETVRTARTAGLAPTGTVPVPALRGLTIDPSRLTPERGRGASILGKLRRGRGAVVSYTDSEAASTTFAVARTQSGFRSGHGCAARPPRHQGGHVKRCTRYTTLGSFTHGDHAGANSLNFSGRVGGRALGAGSYRLLASPRAGGRTGRSVSSTFHIV